MARIYKVLFLCTGNSARSIMAECLLNRLGGRDFRAFSAGSHPRGEVHPLTIALLGERGYSCEGLRSKSWDEFARGGAPSLDCVITVCDQAAAGPCPIWTGELIKGHWGVADPAAAGGTTTMQRQAFRLAYDALEQRVRTMCAGPRSDPAELRRRVEEAGAIELSLASRALFETQKKESIEQ